jgi:excisionase family DNA binding protein
MPKPSESVKRLYTLKEAARYLGRSDWGMRELMWAGKIPFVRTEGGKKFYFDVSDLDDYIKKNKSVFP